ncbi:MAG: hypothetical protein LBF70_01145 [Holosporales bacterium]|jgi:hypothetical protein|nr:hypothetical protein [Holosporales bacterium]
MELTLTRENRAEENNMRSLCFVTAMTYLFTWTEATEAQTHRVLDLDTWIVSLIHSTEDEMTALEQKMTAYIREESPHTIFQLTTEIIRAISNSRTVNGRKEYLIHTEYREPLSMLITPIIENKINDISEWIAQTARHFRTYAEAAKSPSLNNLISPGAVRWVPKNEHLTKKINATEMVRVIHQVREQKTTLNGQFNMIFNLIEYNEAHSTTPIEKGIKTKDMKEERKILTSWNQEENEPGATMFEKIIHIINSRINPSDPLIGLRLLAIEREEL